MRNNQRAALRDGNVTDLHSVVRVRVLGIGDTMMDWVRGYRVRLP